MTILQWPEYAGPCKLVIVAVSILMNVVIYSGSEQRHDY